MLAKFDHRRLHIFELGGGKTRETITDPVPVFNRHTLEYFRAAVCQPYDKTAAILNVWTTLYKPVFFHAIDKPRYIPAG